MKTLTKMGRAVLLHCLFVLVLMAPALASLQLSVAVRNAQLAAVVTTIGISAHLHLYTGAVPANCAAAAPSGLIGNLTLPSSWMGTASGGTIASAGSWTGTASGSGTIASFRFYDSTDTNCGAQGTVTITGAGGDITLDNPTVVSGQSLVISSYSWTAGSP